MSDFLTMTFECQQHFVKIFELFPNIKGKLSLEDFGKFRFPDLMALFTSFYTTNFRYVSGDILLKQKHFLVSEQQNLFPQHMFPARLNWETFVSATMFPSLARPLRTVPTFVTAHTFCASRDTRVSYGWCQLIQGYFCAV